MREIIKEKLIADLVHGGGLDFETQNEQSLGDLEILSRNVSALFKISHVESIDLVLSFT